MCTNNLLTAYYACVNDDAVPVDATGRYTVMISTAAARPKNAVPECGIAWLPSGALPQTVVVLRNMLPSPDFEHSVQRAEPGRERQVMGAYYPEARYLDTPEAAQREYGCHRPADHGR
jgi:hypothetical protein